MIEPGLGSSKIKYELSNTELNQMLEHYLSSLTPLIRRSFLKEFPSHDSQVKAFSERVLDNSYIKNYRKMISKSNESSTLNPLLLEDFEVSQNDSLTLEYQLNRNFHSDSTFGSEVNCECCKDDGVVFSLLNDNTVNAHLCPVCSSNKRDLATQAIRSELISFSSSKYLIYSDNIKKYCSRGNPVSKALANVYSELLEDYKSRSKIETRNIEIKDKALTLMNSPEKFIFLHKRKETDTTAIRFMARDKIFRVISQKERATLSSKSQSGSIIENLYSYEFWSQDNYKYTYYGPHLCISDKRVFLAIVFLHHDKNNFNGIKLLTNFQEIWRTLGNHTKLSKSSIVSIKRSLNRLFLSRIISEKDDRMWGDGIIDGISFHDERGPINFKIEIRFNPYMIKHFIEGSFHNIDIKLLKNLTDWELFLADWLHSHKYNVIQKNLNDFKNELYMKEMELPIFRRQFNKVIKGLIEKNILTKDSKILKGKVFLIKENAGETLDSAPAHTPSKAIEGASLS